VSLNPKVVRSGFTGPASILTYVETPFAIFECGYCVLALITEEMYRAPDGMYRSDEALCEMTPDGEIYIERPESQQNRIRGNTTDST
jgi:hypothetical protein